MLDKNQRIVADNYEGGEFSHVQGVADAGRKLGDGLFNFLLIELSNAEDCDSIDTALHRLETIEREIAEVKKEFLEAQDKQKKYNHAFTIGFSINSDFDGDKVPGHELTEGLRKRLESLLCDPKECDIEEACGAAYDTYENEESGNG